MQIFVHMYRQRDELVNKLLQKFNLFDFKVVDEIYIFLKSFIIN